jgi:3-dehydro-L-gulonate 2-dehydrogenase
MLDMMAALLSGGLATHLIPADPVEESGLSQVFLAFDLSSLGGAASGMADEIIRHFRQTPSGNEEVRYPGERVLNVRRENMEKGIPIDPEVWEQVRSL